MSAEEADAKAAKQLWARSGPQAVTKRAEYDRAVRDLSGKAKLAFDRELLRLALADPRIFTPKLGKKPPLEKREAT